MTQEELNTILENHKKWLSNHEDVDGKYANLHDAYLHGVNLYLADLCGANLSGANLSGATLYDANLSHANLSGADLYCANFTGANLRNADLRGTNLRNANLSGADLDYADLRGADLFNADICGADFRNADLRAATNLPFIPMACPEEGSFIGFKKAANNTIVKLEIPADAKRSSATSSKCRCNKAKVLAIQKLDCPILSIKTVSSRYDSSFIYEVGKIVEVKDFDEDRWNECSTGIHFFINRQDAVDF